MAAIDRIHGKSGQIKMDPTGVGGATAVLVASLDKWDLDMSKALVDVTAFQDANHVYVMGLPDIKGTVGGLYDPVDGLVIFSVIFGTVAPYFELYPTSLGTTPPKFSGRGWLDGKISVPANGAVTITGAFAAAGPWTHP
jgi:hypothetical protein